jgi:hypothetical protein
VLLAANISEGPVFDMFKGIANFPKRGQQSRHGVGQNYRNRKLGWDDAEHVDRATERDAHQLRMAQRIEEPLPGLDERLGSIRQRSEYVSAEGMSGVEPSRGSK